MLNANVEPIGKIYANRFRIPHYQRPYVWSETEVRDLIDDIATTLAVEGEADGKYIIGSITTAKSSDVLDVIDGQQRLTTTFLVICAIRDLMLKYGLGAEEIFVIEQSVSTKKRRERSIHLEAARSGTAQLLDQIFDRRTAELKRHKRVSKHVSREVKNITNNFLFARDYIDKTIAGSPDQEDQYEKAAERLEQFYDFLHDRVHAVIFVTDDAGDAIRLFEGANNRGVSLEQIDLLKTKILGHVIEDPQYHRQWDDLISLVEGKADAFLRYFIAVNFNEVKTKGQIFRWFNCAYKEKKLDIDDPSAVMRQLINNAANYAHYTAFKGPNGRQIEALENVERMGGNKRQHVMLLMAASHLDVIDEKLFELFASEVEKLVFVGLITDDEPKEEEKRYAGWSSDLKKISTQQQLEDFLNRTIRPHRGRHLKEFKNKISAMRSLNKDGDPDPRSVPARMRYTIAKMTQHLQKECLGTGIPMSSLMGNEGYEVEHILPSNDLSPDEPTFDRPAERDQYVSMLANMSMLAQSENGRIQDNDFAQKAPHYSTSCLAISKLLVSGNNGKNTKMAKRAEKDMKPFTQWLSRDIEERAEQLANLAAEIWV